MQAGEGMDLKGTNSSTKIEILPVESPDTRTIKKYKVTIKTSDIRGAGTNASIQFNLSGSLGQSETISLNSVLEKPIHRGQVDTFEIESRDLGRLQSLTLSTCGSGQDWHLIMVNVVDIATGVKTYFWCNDWIKDRRELIAQRREPQENIFYYKVHIAVQALSR